MTTILLILSMLINVFFLFYVRWLIKSMSFISENLDNLWGNLQGFHNHVNAIHETEMFYGDNTLQELLEHSKSLTEEIDNFRDIVMPIGEQGKEIEQEIEVDGRAI